MKNLYTQGDSAFNNALTLEPGRFAVDIEKKALRLHDGGTQGGLAALLRT